MAPDEVLLFHLKNHYALIFALREWVVESDGATAAENGNRDNSSGSSAAAAAATISAAAIAATGATATTRVTIVRQLLTARRGQRPSAWIDFSEARETMLGWEGYKIIAVGAGVDREQLLKMFQSQKL